MEEKIRNIIKVHNNNVHENEIKVHRIKVLKVNHIK